MLQVHGPSLFLGPLKGRLGIVFIMVGHENLPGEMEEWENIKRSGNFIKVYGENEKEYWVFLLIKPENFFLF